MNLDDAEELSETDYLTMLSGLGGDASKKAKPEVVKKWRPSLTPKQLSIFNDTTTPMRLLVSSRFTGKTYACGHAAVRHAYDEWGAIVLIVAKSQSQLLLGVFDTLANEILPQYVENITGFSYDGPKLNAAKQTIFIVKNRHGGNSLIQLMSVADSGEARRKIRGITCSLLILDEATLYPDDEFMEELTGILGRRPHIPPERQRLLATCNPTDPDSWVAKRWSVLDPENRQKGYEVTQFLPEDNPSPHVQSYYERLRRDLAHNPTKYARDIEGKWVAVPSGDALFNGYFIPETHIIGSVADGTGLSPVAGLPIGIGLDLGEGVNHGVSFLQEIPVNGKVVTIIFDEFNSVGKQVSIEFVTRQIMTRLNRWCERVGYDFSTVCASDNSAFNRFRAATGSFDSAEVERFWRVMMPSFPRVKYPLRVLEAPKGDGSVEFSVRLVRDLFTRGELLVSATHCPDTVEMLKNITGTKKTPMAPDIHDSRKHILDAIRYYLVLNRAGGVVVRETETIKPEILRVGR